jgi:hypothetical protein
MEEGKPFTVRDRRKFTAQGDLKNDPEETFAPSDLAPEPALQVAASPEHPGRLRTRSAVNGDLRRAIKLYEAARYDQALGAWQAVVKERPELEPSVRQCVAYSRAHASRKLRSPKDAPANCDDLYETSRRLLIASVLLWLPLAYCLSPLAGLSGENARALSGASLAELVRLALGACITLCLFLMHTSIPYGLFARRGRCKHCGHYTAFIAPNDGLAYFGSNNCEICGRSYPMPSVRWDSEEGRRYMYERGSVTEPEFYREFEAAHPAYPRSDAARQALERRPDEEETEDF